MALQVRNTTGIEADKIRQDFPMLSRGIHGKPLLYLDNAGSSLKLRSVLDRHRDFYAFEYANTNEENSLSQNATKAVKDVRSSVASLLGASSAEEVVFLRSATEAMNLVAHAFESSQLQPGDESLLRKWSTTLTSFHGRLLVKDRGQNFELLRSRVLVSWT